MLPQTALKYEAEVKEDGRVELTLPYPPGAHVVIFVIESTDDALADFERHRCGRLNAGRRETGLGQFVRELHREATRVSRAEELFWGRDSDVALGSCFPGDWE